MNEHAARDVVLVRAIETADGAREIWSDADRVWAGRTAAEVVGESASDDAFLGHRATLALQRLATRHPKIKALARGSSARGWLVPVGAAGIDIGPAHRINLLAPPVLALLVWNLAVFAMLLWGELARRRSRAGDRGRPVRRKVIAWLGGVTRPVRESALPAPLAAAATRFAADWWALATPLWGHRAARLLHFCAATLAAGAIAGLYLRGIALEYRTGWQSTFLDAADVAGLLRVVLAPGSWLTGIPIPGADRLQAIAGYGAGENAAPWIHLYAATILLVVIVPRLAVATLAWFREWRVARRMPVVLGQAYFQRLLHARREGTARIAAVPYSYDIAKASAAGLAQLLTRVFESAVDIRWSPAVAYGAEILPEIPDPQVAAVAAVFNLSATPERENHGAFLDALRTSVNGRAPVVGIVDTSDFVSRFHANPQRIAERQGAWRQTLAEHGADALFVRLAEPDLPNAAAALAERLNPGMP